MVIESIVADGRFFRLGISSTYDDNNNDLEVHRIAIFKSRVNEFFSRVGYCTCYTKPFNIVICGAFNLFLTDEERLAEERRIEERLALERLAEGRRIKRRVKKKLSINDSRTFKLEQCVICLEKEPKVLFCNCGHICICDECFVKKLDNCPVCKEKNAILRMIE